MSSTYKYEEEDIQAGRARRSKAASLRFSVQGARGVGKKTVASPPQAIVKVAGWAHTPSSVMRMLDYVARVEDKEERELVALESEDGVQRQGQAEVEEIYEEWRPDFERRSKGERQSREAVHLVLSAKAELTPENVEKTLAAARRVVEKHFGEAGYQYALGVHQDGKSPHVHAVIKTTSREKGTPKLRLNPKDLLEVRKSLAKELTREGLAHVASRQPKKEKVRHSNLKGATPDTLKKVKAVLKKLTKEQRQFERAMARKKPTVHAIKFRQQQGTALDTLRDQTKNDQELTGKDRQEAFNLIRSFRREVEKKEKDPLREVEATVNHFESRMAKWQKQLEKELAAVEQGKHNKPTLSKATVKTGENLNRDIQRFVKHDLKGQQIPVEMKKAVFKRLREPVREMLKVQERGVGRGR